MPINRADYPPDWKAISLRIRFERAAGRCECVGECGLHPGKRCEEQNGEPAKWARGVVMLTVAHLNHDTNDNREENLKALCNRCHLRLDNAQHVQNARRTLFQRKAIGALPGLE